MSPYYVQVVVRCFVFYTGTKNEGGYAMFDINKLCAHMKAPWNIECIPNCRHASEPEKQFLDWQMWVAHVFSGRPLTRISELQREETATGTRFQVWIDSPNKLILVQAYYTFCDDVPHWRNLVCCPTLMYQGPEGPYEGYLPGKTPDAWRRNDRSGRARSLWARHGGGQEAMRPGVTSDTAPVR